MMAEGMHRTTGDPFGLEGIQSRLKDVEIRRAAAEHELGQTLLRESIVVQQAKASLDAMRPLLDRVEYQINALSETVGSAQGLSEQLTLKIRQLDAEKTKVSSLIKEVQDIQEIQTCIHGLNDAMRDEDYERAAVHVHRYRSFDHRLLNEALLGVGKDNLELMQVMERKLKDVLLGEFRAALQAADASQIRRFLRLLPMVGLGQDALVGYTDYIVRQLRKIVDERLLSGQDRAALVKLLLAFFDQMARTLTSQEGLIQEMFGPGKMLHMLHRLWLEGDRQGFKILCGFLEKADYDRRVKDIRAYFKRSFNPTAPHLAPIAELQEIAALSADAVAIGCYMRLYRQLFTRMAKSQFDLLEAAADTGRPDVSVYELPRLGQDGWASFLRTGDLHRKVQELMGHYLSLEEYFATRSIERVFAMEEFDGASPTTSCVDDVFLILKACVARVRQLGDTDILCAMINLVTKCVEVDYMGTLQSRLGAQENAELPKGVSREVYYKIALNNIDMSCEYIVRFRRDVESSVVSAASMDLEKDQIKFSTCLQSLADVASNYQAVLHSALEHLFGQLLKPSLRALVAECLREARYVLGEEDFAQIELDNVFVNRFATEFQKLMAPHKAHLTERNFSSVFSLAGDFFCKEFEHFIFKCKLNQLGALQLDKDIRALAHFMGSVSSTNLREKFTRLGQMSTLLNMSRPSDILDYWGKEAEEKGVPAWRFSAQQIRQILGLRVEFRQDQIASLSLQEQARATMGNGA